MKKLIALSPFDDLTGKETVKVSRRSWTIALDLAWAGYYRHQLGNILARDSCRFGRAIRSALERTANKLDAQTLAEVHRVIDLALQGRGLCIQERVAPAF